MRSETKALVLMFIALIAEVVLVFTGPAWAYAPLHLLFMFSFGSYWYLTGKAAGEEDAYQNILNGLRATSGQKEE